MSRISILLVLMTVVLSVPGGASTRLAQCATITAEDKYVLSDDISFAPVAAGEACLQFEAGSEGSTLDCQGHKIVGDPIDRNGVGLRVFADGVTVRNCGFDNNLIGLRADGAVGVKVEDNVFLNPRFRAIDLRGRSDWLVTGNKVTINAAFVQAISLLANSPYPEGATLVEDNNVDVLVSPPSRDNLIVFECRTALDNVVISDNNLNSVANGPVVSVISRPACSTVSPDSILVENNHVTSTNNSGVSVFGGGGSTAGITVRGNYIDVDDPGSLSGISLGVGGGGTLEHILVEGNIVAGGVYGGIGAAVYPNASMGSDVVIRYNTIRGGGVFQGALFSNGAAGVEYRWNAVNGAGIGFSAQPNDVSGASGDNCVVVGNFFGNNDLAADLSGSSGTKFEDNTLINNAVLFVGEDDDIVQDNEVH